MLRPWSLLSALAAATLAAAVLTPAVQAGPAQPGPATAPRTSAPQATAVVRRADDAPLAVSIDSLTPSTLPQSGPIRVSGTVTNLDDEPWHTVNLYPFASQEPMTTTAELTDAAAEDPDADLGPRITDPGPYFVIEDLEAGETKPYSFAIPRRRITATAPGVYWFGVHASGESTSVPRDQVADGKARTFLPLVPANQTAQVDTALVVPLRHSVSHESDGRLADVDAWASTLSARGQLRALADFGVAAGDRPLTWLVDPAVTDAAVRLTQGNPARSLAPTIQQGEGESESPSPSDPAASPEEDADEEEAADTEAELSPEAIDRANVATDWLARLHTALEGAQILGLPYGDLDVSAAAESRPNTYETARDRSGTELAPWGLPTTPAVVPPSGYLSTTALDQLPSDTRVLVSDRMVGSDALSVASTGGHTMVVGSSGAASGGPGPDDPLAPVAMRQRILGEAAVRLLSDGGPLTVVLPSTWAPAYTNGFFAGLDVPWVDLSTVDEIAQHTATAVPVEDLTYPQSQQDAELTSIDFTTAADLIRAGDTLQNLLTLNDRVGGEVRDEALANLSYAARSEPSRTRAASQRSEDWIDQRLHAIDIQAPSAVILSSDSGGFSVTVTNELAEPVTVRIRAVTDPRLEVTVPAEAIDVGAEAHSTVLLHASAQAQGVRTARLQLTDTEGNPTGTSDSLPIRPNQVGNVIWLILGTGVALLLATIVLRLVRRLRSGARS